MVKKLDVEPRERTNERRDAFMEDKTEWDATD
jgi:hypothetical protein